MMTTTTTQNSLPRRGRGTWGGSSGPGHAPCTCWREPVTATDSAGASWLSGGHLRGSEWQSSHPACAKQPEEVSHFNVSSFPEATHMHTCTLMHTPSLTHSNTYFSAGHLNLPIILSRPCLACTHLLSYTLSSPCITHYSHLFLLLKKWTHLCMLSSSFHTLLRLSGSVAWPDMPHCHMCTWNTFI